MKLVFLLIFKLSKFESFRNLTTLVLYSPFFRGLIDFKFFQVSKLLGKGGFGAVYHIIRLHDQTPFAMKCETYDVKKQVSSFRLYIFHRST